GDALQTEPCCEQPLDHVIMQVSGNAVPILQHPEPLLIGPSVAEFQGDGSLARESLGHVKVGFGEGRGRDDPARHGRTARTCFGPEGEGHRLAHRDIRPQVEIDTRLLINPLDPNAVTLLHRLPSDAVDIRIVKTSQLTFSRTGSDDYLYLALIIVCGALHGSHSG